MKRKLMISIAFLLLLSAGNSCYSGDYSARTPVLYSESSKSADRAASGIVADHTSIRIDRIPLDWVERAKKQLHIAYGHTSHGSQITEGMRELTNLRKGPYVYKNGSPEGSLDIKDNPFGGDKDLGNPDNKTWAAETRKYLEKNPQINVVMWSWCGQLSNAGKEFVQNYLDLMQSLEEDFPNVTFVYMTGHLDGTGENGTLEKNNRQIREFCKNNGKVLFDFSDIESYNPDGTYFGDKYANDACEYDSNGDKKPDKNWAIEWQDSHKKGIDWYQCYSAHSQPLNANMKAYAMWHLLAEIAGWDAESEDDKSNEGMSFEFYARRLQALNLFLGTEKGFDLERVPTRLESAAMLTRLLGGEKEAAGKLYPHPFKDAEKTWGNHYVGYLYQYNLAKGLSDNKFGCDKELDAETYITFLLRILGYSDSSPDGDFSWDNSIEAAGEFGIISTEYCTLLKDTRFNRGHMAKLTYLCLYRKIKGNSMTLLDKLVDVKAVDEKAFEEGE